MKLKLCFLLIAYGAIFYGMAEKEIEEIALEAESKINAHEVGKPTGEMKIRSFLKEKMITNSNDITKIINLAFEIKKNPALKNKFKKDISQPNDVSQNQNNDVAEVLSDQEILSLAKEAKLIWDKNGNMGEFAARKFLKTNKNITNKKNIDLIINKIVDLRQTKNTDNKPKKVDKSDNVNKDQKSVAKVSPEVEKWARILKNLDPETQTFKIIKKLNEENVDKSLQGKILMRIRELRSDSSVIVSDNSSDSIEKQEEQAFRDVERKSDIQKLITILSANEKAMIQFIQVIKFKIHNNMNILWQDLVLYFYFTTLERPVDYSKEQIAYDWILKHHMDDIYKSDNLIENKVQS